MTSVTLKVAFVSRDPAVRLAGAKALERAPSDWSIELVEEASLDADVLVCGPDVPDCGGIAFDLARPDAVLASIAAATQRASVIAVTGAGGGCGVTTIALHLARRYGSCLVECDPRAGAAERLGLERSSLRTWVDAGATRASTRLAALPMAAGFRALFAPHEEAGSIEDVVRTAAEQFRTIVLDVPFGASPPARRDAIVLVMPATRPGAMRARRLLESWPSSARSAVVVNRQGPGGECTRAQLQRLSGAGIALELPCCAALRDAEDEGQLASRGSRWARRVEGLAVALVGQQRTRSDPG